MRIIYSWVISKNKGFIPIIATDSYIIVISLVVLNWNYEDNKYLKNRNKSNSRIINLQNRQTDDFFESCVIIIFIFTNLITLYNIKLFIFYDSISFLYFFYEI
jgi:hypothetical protein